MLVVSLLALVFALAVTNMMSEIILLPVWQQFIIVTIPIYVVGALMIGLGIRDGIKKVFGVMCVLAAMDLITPPYMVSMEGLIASADLATASIASVLLLIYTTIGVPPGLVWYVIYPMSFTIFLGAGIFLLSKKEFKGLFHGS